MSFSPGADSRIREPALQHATAHRRKPINLQRKASVSSDSSNSSQITALSSSRPSPSPYHRANSQASTSTASVPSSTRALPPRKSSYDVGARRGSPAAVSPNPDLAQLRARHHSQGFFEPTLPTASYSNTPVILPASQIAAQAAAAQHARRVSQTSISQTPATVLGKRGAAYSSSVQASQPVFSSGNLGVQGRASPQPQTGSRFVATAAANVVFPKSPLQSPSTESPGTSSSQVTFDTQQKPGKERSRMKIFSKPRAINISKDKNSEKKSVTIASPSKNSLYSSATMPRMANQSTTSLASSSVSSASSIYSRPNVSSSTLVPSDRSIAGGAEKEKSRHKFLSRHKNKLKDNLDQFNLPLSSASSNSRPADPSAPQSLYSFVPSSPAALGAFNKSISGLDLRHGGRALWDKKREDKAAASGYAPAVPTSSLSLDPNRDVLLAGGPSTPIGSTFGPASGLSNQPSDVPSPAQNLAGFGLAGMSSDDAWPLLKARLLSIFEGEDLRTPIEDFNRLLSVHLQRCVQRQVPNTVIDDVRDLLRTGFSSLDQTLRRIPDEQLVPRLVETWSSVFCTILPFMQAVFLPLDLEFKGHGAFLSRRDAAEFWGGVPPLAQTTQATSSTETNLAGRSSTSPTSLGECLDVHTLVLLAFRDVVILPRHDTLLAIFSRLSLDSINAGPVDASPVFSPPQYPRPGTGTSSPSASVGVDPSSFNSQGSTLLDSSTAGSLGARSRATSNTSAGSFHSLSSQRVQPTYRAQQPPPPIMDSAKATEIAARMLQCVSVLSGLQTPGAMLVSPRARGNSTNEGGDSELVARRKTERLAKELKLNWLGRGRTGRNRRGFVGSKVKTPIGLGIGVNG